MKASLDQFQAAKLVKLCFDLRLVHGLRVLSGVHVFRLTLFACSFLFVCTQYALYRSFPFEDKPLFHNRLCRFVDRNGYFVVTKLRPSVFLRRSFRVTVTC